MISLLIELAKWCFFAGLFVFAFKSTEHLHLSLEGVDQVIRVNPILFFVASLTLVWIIISTYQMLQKSMKYALSLKALTIQKQKQQVIAHYDSTIQCLFEGRYQKALQHTQQADQLMDNMPDTDWTERRILFRLAAARANLLDKKFEEAELTLEEKILQHPSADVARCLIGAQISLERKNPTKALEFLDYLEQHQGLHRQAYQLKLRALQRVGQWKKVGDTVQAMLKRGFIEPVAASHLERLSAAHQIRECEAHPKALQHLWNQLPEELQAHPELLREWLERSHNITQNEALTWLFKGIDRSLQKQWDNTLWTTYAFHPALSPQRALAHGEEWLKEYRDNTHLLRDLGILCTQLELWGKAESYLDAARSIHPERATLRAIFNLYRAQQDHEKAQTLIREIVEQEITADHSSLLQPAAAND